MFSYVTLIFNWCWFSTVSVLVFCITLDDNDDDEEEAKKQKKQKNPTNPTEPIVIHYRGEPFVIPSYRTETIVRPNYRIETNARPNYRTGTAISVVRHLGEAFEDDIYTV